MDETGSRRRVSDKHAISRAAANPLTLALTVLTLSSALIGSVLFLVQADHDNHDMASRNEVHIANLERARVEDKTRQTADNQEIKQELGKIDAKLDALLLQRSRPPD